MNLARLAAAALAATVVAACGGSTTSISEISAAPGAVRCQTAVGGSSSTIPHAGSQLTVNVEAARDCSWTARSEASWAQISPSSGQGQAALSVTIGSNPDPATRSAAIVVNDARVTLTQEAAPCRFQLGSSQNQLSYEGGRTGIPVTTASACRWRAASDVPWAQVIQTSGTGSGTVEIDVAVNSGAERTATITIADQSVTLVQQARSGQPLPPGGDSPPPSPGCAIALDSSDRSFGAAGGEGSFRVITTRECGWTATTNTPWIELLSSRGAGTDTVRYRVAQNTTAAARTGAIGVSGRTHVVRQDAAAGSGEGGGGSVEPRVELSGRALLVDGSCPSISFILDLRRVFTNSDTRFRGECSAIRTGTRVRVEGRIQSDGRVRATDVQVRNGDDDD